jgi:hypothetical protein
VAVAFDFLIYSYSFSIKRIGMYTRLYIEPALAELGHMPPDFVQWQPYLSQCKTRQRLALSGNFGTTLLSVIMGSIALLLPHRPAVRAG